MSTVPYLVSPLRPASDHFSLNLDLSLGGLSSEQHASSETSVTTRSGVTGCEVAATSYSRGCSTRNSASPALCGIEAVRSLSLRAMQTQRWHAARKRRKSIIEEKLHRKFTGGNLSLGAAQTQLCLADCMMSNETVDTCKSAVPFDHGHGLSWGVRCSLKPGMDGYASSPTRLRTSHEHGKLRLCFPSAESDASEDQCTSVSHMSCEDSLKDQCIPCVESSSTLSLCTQTAPYAATSLPKCASSSSVSNLVLGKRRGGEGVGVDDQDRQKRPDSSSSGLENARTFRHAQSNMPSESSEAQSSGCNNTDGHSSSSMLTSISSMAYPYTTGQGMTFPYPGRYSPQWGASPPWSVNNFPRIAIEPMSHMSFSSERADEATSLPRSHSTPYNLDQQSKHDNMASSPLHPFIPASGTENTSTIEGGAEEMENDVAVHPSTEFVEVDVKDNVANNEHFKIVIESDEITKSARKEVKFNVKAEKAMKRKQLQKQVISQGAHGDSIMSGAGCASSEACQKLVASSQNCGSGGKKHPNLPDSCGRVPKKVKLVRFNSLDNKVIQLEQEQDSHSHHWPNDTWLESDASIHSCIDEKMESLQAYSAGHRLHFHGNSGEQVQVNQCDIQTDNINLRREFSEGVNIVSHIQNDEESYREHAAADDKEDVHTQSVLKSSDDKQEDEAFATMLRVTTHGSGPLGRIIHGVMYITKEKQVRLICSCHSKHMSSLEFVQHSGSDDLLHPERSIVLRPLPHVQSGLSCS